MKAAAAIAYLIAAYLIVGTLDYNQQVAAAQEAKAERDQARIWSKKCAKQGLQIFATQKDGGKWEIRCVDGRVRT